MQPHEYSIVGHSHAAIGCYIGAAAGLCASLATVVAALALDLASFFGFSDN